MAFRRIGGYLYTISLLVNMEGALTQPAKAPWDQGKVFFKILNEKTDCIFFSASGRHFESAKIDIQGFDAIDAIRTSECEILFERGMFFYLVIFRKSKIFLDLGAVQQRDGQFAPSGLFQRRKQSSEGDQGG